MQRITAPATEVCPKCGKPTAHRLISAGTNFILKGGGWYSDLYSSTNGGAKKTESKGGSTTDSPATTESKTDAKPAAAPTPTTPPSSTPTSS